MAEFSRREFLILSIAVAGAAAITGCVGKEPTEVAVTPGAAEAVVTPGAEPTPTAEEITVYETRYDGRYYNTATNVPGLVPSPISFAYMHRFLREKVAGRVVFDPSSVPFFEGTVTLQPQPDGKNHYFTILSTPTEQGAAAAGLVEGYACTTYVDPNGNSLSHIPAGETSWSLTIGIVKSLFKATINPQADGHFATDRLPESLGQGYAAAYLAARLGNSYDGYKSFVPYLLSEGYLEDKVALITFEAYMTLTWDISQGQLPELFTLQTPQ